MNKRYWIVSPIPFGILEKERNPPPHVECEQCYRKLQANPTTAYTSEEIIEITDDIFCEVCWEQDEAI